MTMKAMTYEAMIKVIEAYKEGKHIEVCDSEDHPKTADWSPIAQGENNYQFDFASYRYRVKQEPRELFVNEYPTRDGVKLGNPSETSNGRCYFQPAHAKDARGSVKGRTVRFVEDLEWKEGEADPIQRAPQVGDVWITAMNVKVEVTRVSPSLIVEPVDGGKPFKTLRSSLVEFISSEEDEEEDEDEEELDEDEELDG